MGLPKAGAISILFLYTTDYALDQKVSCLAHLMSLPPCPSNGYNMTNLMGPPCLCRSPSNSNYWISNMSSALTAKLQCVFLFKVVQHYSRQKIEMANRRKPILYQSPMEF